MACRPSSSPRHADASPRMADGLPIAVDAPCVHAGVRTEEAKTRTREQSALMESNLFSLDIYDLHILHSLFQELSVTRVAEREGVSQPTISKILAKLRKALGDNLLVKGPSGLTLTDRAELLRGPL